MHILPRLAGVAALLLGAAPASADIYSLVDEFGVKHITNQPDADPRWTLVIKSRETVPGYRPPGARKAGAAGAIRASQRRAYREEVRHAVANYQIEEALVRAVIHAESGFNPQAVSRKGACGLMQLMPATADRYGVADIFDPTENITGGVRYLSDLTRLFKADLRLVLAAYNAGENAVLRHGGVPPYPETLAYVDQVLALRQQYLNAN